MATDDTEVNDDPDKDSSFYFESDHLALKGNQDYKMLLKTIVILQAQRTQALKDLDELMACRDKALKDPISYVAQFQCGDLPKYPGPQKVADLPSIDWSKYNISVPDMRLRPQTRHANILPQLQAKENSENDKILVRGRPFDESKPETFNQLWTADEQRRLEELLKEYPPEEVEMRRWTKIANALGNRTPKQVSSRVQKYFIKLLRAGLPIPGRGPKVKVDVKRNVSRHHKSNYFMQKKSTFFPHQDMDISSSDLIKEQPVQDELMNNYFDDNSGTGNDEESVELRQIELIRQIKTEKEDNQSSAYQHVGHKCFVCGEDPVRGTRWHCTDCQDGVDLCGDCAVGQLEAEVPVHTVSHKLTPIRPPDYSRSYDFDYLPHIFNNSSYNYLDPNFLPE